MSRDQFFSEFPLFLYGHSIVACCSHPSLCKTILCWNFKTIYGGQEPSINSVVVPACQATQAGGSDSLESIPGLLKSFKIRTLLLPNCPPSPEKLCCCAPTNKWRITCIVANSWPNYSAITWTFSPNCNDTNIWILKGTGSRDGNKIFGQKYLLLNLNKNL